MKKVLSVLLAFVFFEVQAMAMHGPEGGVGLLGIQGTYAGALLPTSKASEDAEGVNGLGLFSLSIPATGVGQGTFVYFQQGQTFTGTINGVANPDDNTLVGLVSGEFNVTQASLNFVDPVFGNESISQSQTVAVVSGELQADFNADTEGVSGVVLEGKAVMEISIPPTTTTSTTTDAAGNTTTSTSTTGSLVTSSLTLIVDGFQQSTSSGGITDLTQLGSNSTGTGTGS